MVSHLFLMTLTLEHREFKQLKVRQTVSKQIRGSAPGCRFRLSPHPLGGYSDPDLWDAQPKASLLGQFVETWITTPYSFKASETRS